MTDLRTLVRDQMERAGSPGYAFDDLGRRRDRKRRNQRLAAGIVGIAVFLAAVWILVSSGPLDRSGTPAEPVPTPPAPMPTPTPESSTPTLDVSFLDVRSGALTAFPSNWSMYGMNHVQISPDGDRLAFQDGDVIYVGRIDGSAIRRLDAGSSPWWSPDGGEIVYQKGNGIYIIDVASGRSRRIFDGGDSIIHPNFSPDGERILFTWLRPNTPGFALWTISVDGGTPQALPLPHSEHTFPAFGTYSPDGTRIAFRRTQYDGLDPSDMTADNIWVADADGRNPRPLGRVRGWMSQINPTALWPTWSPDGTRIAYERLYSRGIRIVDAITGIPQGFFDGSNPSWVDDHTLIVEDATPTDESGR